MNKDEAVEDFKKRIQHYQSFYEPLGDDETEKCMSFIKIYNQGEKYLVNRVQGKCIELFYNKTIHIPLIFDRPAGHDFNLYLVIQ